MLLQQASDCDAFSAAWLIVTVLCVLLLGKMNCYYFTSVIGILTLYSLLQYRTRVGIALFAAAAKATTRPWWVNNDKITVAGYLSYSRISTDD